MAKDYLPIKVDTRMQNSKAVIKRLRGERGGGIPWMTILDAEGKELVTSDGPGGNVGCPVQDDEITWFMSMIGTSSQHMEDADKTTIETSLKAFAKKILKR